MKEFKGTAGPWVVDGAGVGAEFNIDSADGVTSVGITSQIFRDKDHEIRTANANLIAAAPELLEALLRVRAQFSQAGFSPIAGSLNPVEDNFAFINSAIDKALGESK